MKTHGPQEDGMRTHTYAFLKQIQRECWCLRQTWNANPSLNNPPNIVATLPPCDGSTIVLLDFRRGLQSIQYSFILGKNSSEVFSDICWALLSFGASGHLPREDCLLISCNWNPSASMGLQTPFYGCLCSFHTEVPFSDLQVISPRFSTVDIT